MADKKSNALQKPDIFRLKLPADSENLDIIRRFISGIATNMGFSGDGIYEIELAVDEACANVVKHAYADGDPDDHVISVTVRSKSDRIEIRIADRGAGFNPDGLEAPVMEKYLQEMKSGGLGVHLIRTLMDEVKFYIKPGVRNEVKMVKFLQQ